MVSLALMEPRTPDLASLRHGIDAAFARRSYPGDERIVSRQPGCRGIEAEEVFQFLHGQDWRQLAACSPPKDLRDEMAFLSFEGFVYYLPAFLLLALDRTRLHDASEPLVFMLWSFPEQIASLLEPAEKKSVVQTLEYLAAEYDHQKRVTNEARVALEHFWAYFTDQELGLV